MTNQTSIVDIVVARTATFSPCLRYRFDLTRTWDDRPRLLVVMFNPSDADHERDDPTVTLLTHITRFNGYGGFMVCNASPLISSTPAEAVDMINTWEHRQAWDERDALHENITRLVKEVERAGAILLAWGALGSGVQGWMDTVEDEICSALPAGVPIYCLGKTKHGFPLHPMARGKHKVPKNAELKLWSEQ